MTLFFTNLLDDLPDIFRPWDDYSEDDFEDDK